MKTSKDIHRLLARKSTSELKRIRAKAADGYGLPQYWAYHILTRRERKFRGECCAEIHHGPGHQTSTFCQLTGKHRIHSACYGSSEEVAYWRGKSVCSGYFDEPPTLK